MTTWTTQPYIDPRFSAAVVTCDEHVQPWRASYGPYLTTDRAEAAAQRFVEQHRRLWHYVETPEEAAENQYADAVAAHRVQSRASLATAAVWTCWRCKREYDYEAQDAGSLTHCAACQADGYGPTMAQEAERLHPMKGAV